MKTVKLYYVDPVRKEAVVCFTKCADIVKQVAKEVKLIKVAKSFFNEYRLNHKEKVLVL